MKILHRLYITVVKCNKMNATFSEKCWHGCDKEAPCYTVCGNVLLVNGNKCPHRGPPG